MVEQSRLVVGAFYWVKPAPGALDARGEWQAGMQPARYAGVSSEGEPVWNFLAVGGCSDWPVIKIGDVCIEPPGNVDASSPGDPAMESVRRLLSIFGPKSRRDRQSAYPFG